ncbi:hypothetical protein [Lacipirellula sp.]|uniref:hypothetical protein n=1 Tax=Lacipirellula sp. TaxID=2691419 RepID=UPI003D11519F
MFDGIRFSEPYIYRTDEAKKLLQGLCDEVQHRPDLARLGVDPNEPRRSRITGKLQEHVWDFLPLAIPGSKVDAGTRPHLSVDLSVDGASAYFTVPNAFRRQFVRALKEMELEGYVETVTRCADKLNLVVRRSPEASPIVRVLQRHYIGRSNPVVDGQLVADLRTAAGSESGDLTNPTVKPNYEWIRASYHLMLATDANLQFSIGVGFPYACETVQSAAVTDLFAETWISLTELILPLLATGEAGQGSQRS